MVGDLIEERAVATFLDRLGIAPEVAHETVFQEVVLLPAIEFRVEFDLKFGRFDGRRCPAIGRGLRLTLRGRIFARICRPDCAQASSPRDARRARDLVLFWPPRFRGEVA